MMPRSSFGCSETTDWLSVDSKADTIPHGAAGTWLDVDRRFVMSGVLFVQFRDELADGLGEIVAPIEELVFRRPTEEAFAGYVVWRTDLVHYRVNQPRRSDLVWLLRLSAIATEIRMVNGPLFAGAHRVDAGL